MKVFPLPDGDVAIRRPWTGEVVVSHYYMRQGEGLRVVWVCVNCGQERDD